METLKTDTIKGVLSFISAARADSYDSWVKVGMAIKNADGNCDLWEEWSKQSPKYKTGECEKKWRTFNKTNATPLGMGTLVMYAKQDGGYIAKNSLPKQTRAEMVRDYVRAVFRPKENINFVISLEKEDGRFYPSSPGITILYEYLYDCVENLVDEDPDCIVMNPSGVQSWIRINPTDGFGVSSENIAAYRNCLLESDELDIAEQERILRESQLPIRAIVYSGGKSLHAIIAVDADNEKEYKERVASIYDYATTIGLKPDKNCKNANRLSRFPEAYRGEVKQRIIYVNTEAKYIELPQIDSWEVKDLLAAEIDMTQNLLGNRYLERGGGLLLFAESGIGKSVFATQLAMYAAIGKSFLGIKIAKPLKVLYIQAENNKNDVINTVQDIANYIQADFETYKNLKITHVDAMTGKVFINYLESECEKIRPDLLIVDPLLAYLGGDAMRQDVVSEFLRVGINPLLRRFKMGFIVIHHTGKPKTKQDGTTLDHNNYTGFGSSDLVNWARAIMIISKPNGASMEDNLFELRLDKRGKMSGTDRFKRIAHGRDGIYWEEIGNLPYTLQEKIFAKLSEMKPSTTQNALAALKQYYEKEAQKELLHQDAQKMLKTARERKFVIYDHKARAYKGKNYSELESI